jgi:large subunit ribosomal protein L15
MHLSKLKPAFGSTKKRKRIARGESSGHGGTSTRGHKGQNSRAGGGVRPGFEGGQMPLYRRLPKLGGFKNIFRKEYSIVNLERLNGLESNLINPEVLEGAGIIKKKELLVKILGEGEISKPLIIEAHKFSKSALEKIKKAGGQAKII